MNTKAVIMVVVMVILVAILGGFSTKCAPLPPSPSNPEVPPPRVTSCPACPVTGTVPAGGLATLPEGFPMEYAEGEVTASCVHSEPSINSAVSATEFTKAKRNYCSWWGDVGGHGVLPRHRLGAVLATVPPRALCHAKKVCLADKSLCLANGNNAEKNPVQFCPHHDGPVRLSLDVCPEPAADWKTHGICEEAQNENGLGKGRNYVMVGFKYIADAGNVWHWIGQSLNLFGAIVQADPQLLDENNNFRKTYGNLNLMTLPWGFQGRHDIEAVPPIRERAEEVRKALQSLTHCKVKYPNPSEAQCFDNTVMGTTTNVFVQWEEQPFDPLMHRYANAFAKHMLGVFTEGLEEKTYTKHEMASPWSRVYTPRTKPKLLILLRGEESGQTAVRQLTNLEELVNIAKQAGYDVTTMSPDRTTTLASQMRAVADTDVLMGVHGAGLAWSILLPPHGVLVELRPTRDLVDRTFIYPNIAGVRELGYLEWHQTEAITPSKDRRLAFNTHFTVTNEAAVYFVELSLKKVARRAPWLRKEMKWIPQA